MTESTNFASIIDKYIEAIEDKNPKERYIFPSSQCAFIKIKNILKNNYKKTHILSNVLHQFYQSLPNGNLSVMKKQQQQVTKPDSKVTQTVLKYLLSEIITDGK